MERLTFKMDTNDFNLSSWQDTADKIERECVINGDIILFGYEHKGGDTIIEYGLLLRPKRDDKELVSDCCGADLKGIVSADGLARCPECHEGCCAEEVEEQEEWSVRLGTILNDNCIDILDEDGAELKEDLEKFISQLLSERTFTKEELKILECGLVRVISETGKFKQLNVLQGKISKLLKEVENE
jgi:hypothetical protein